MSPLAFTTKNVLRVGEMATIKISCDNCCNEEETTAWACGEWAKVCRYCGNDVCPECKGSEDNVHPACELAEKAEDEETEDKP
jgi:hypothetical protein